MAGYRVQAKTLDDFKVRHPGFVRHWDPASFWAAMVAGLRGRATRTARRPRSTPDRDARPTSGTPLPLAFFWSAGRGACANHPGVSAGFKQDERADIRVVSRGRDANGLLHLHSAVRSPQLSETEASTGDAWISADHHLVRVTFDARGERGNAQGEVHFGWVRGRATSALIAGVSSTATESSTEAAVFDPGPRKRPQNAR